MVQIAAGFAPLNTNNPMGNQARGETGRSKLIRGLNMRDMNSNRPITKPIGIPTKAAKPNPTATRLRELSTFHPTP